jgi:hypothetical protein
METLLARQRTQMYGVSTRTRMMESKTYIVMDRKNIIPFISETFSTQGDIK